MLATSVKNSQDHQVGIGEQPFFGLRSSSFCGASEKPEVLTTRKALEVIQADSREPGDFIRGKELLAGFDGDQFSLTPMFDAASIVNAATEHRAIVFPFLYTKTL
jgi:hypothetical protein